MPTTKTAIAAVLLFLALIASPKNASSLEFPECKLIPHFAYKTATSNTVYYITDDCSKRAFANGNIFFTYFDSWQEVKTTTEVHLLSTPDDPVNFIPYGPKHQPGAGALIKTVNDADVFVIVGNKKYRIPSEEVFYQLRYQTNQIQDVDQTLLNEFETNGDYTDTTHHPNYTLIKNKNSPKIYILEPDILDATQQVKRHIRNEADFHRHGFRAERVIEIDDSETYPDSAIGKFVNSVTSPLHNMPDGRVVKAIGNNIPSVFPLDDPGARYILHSTDKGRAYLWHEKYEYLLYYIKDNIVLGITTIHPETITPESLLDLLFLGQDVTIHGTFSEETYTYTPTCPAVLGVSCGPETHPINMLRLEHITAFINEFPLNDSNATYTIRPYPDDQSKLKFVYDNGKDIPTAVFFYVTMATNGHMHHLAWHETESEQFVHKKLAFHGTFYCPRLQPWKQEHNNSILCTDTTAILFDTLTITQ